MNLDLFEVIKSIFRFKRKKTVQDIYEGDFVYNLDNRWIVLSEQDEYIIDMIKIDMTPGPYDTLTHKKLIHKNDVEKIKGEIYAYR